MENERKRPLSEEELGAVSGGRITTELPEVPTGAELYIRWVDRDSGEVSPWRLYNGPQGQPEWEPKASGTYTVEYLIVSRSN